MKIEIKISLKYIKTKEGLFKKLYERELRLQKIYEYDNHTSWDRLSDDLKALDYPDETKDINVVFTEWLAFENNLPEESVSLLSVLAWNTDPAQRVDSFNFTFQIRLDN